MINLIDPLLYNNSFTWGNADSEYGLWVDSPNNVVWSRDMVSFYVKKEPISGWYMDKNWNRVDVLGQYSSSRIVSKDLFHFGSYVLRCFLPTFRGTWPAFWFIDTTLPASQGGTGMGIPPEVDVFEYMRKKGFWRRWKTSHTYHDISGIGKYSRMICKSHCAIKPVDTRMMEFIFHWDSNKMIWEVNGKEVMSVYSKEVRRFPDQPMNIVLDHVVGPWEIRDDKISPFIVIEFYKF